jgi:DNA-binding IclR family transcriptional regulator
MTLKEIAEELGRTSQELFRVVRCLASRGYLLRDGAQRLRLSTKLFELGSRHSSTQALVARAMPHMEKFAEETGESCSLLIVVRDRLLVIAEAESAAQVRFGLRVGALVELFRSIAGRVAVAFQSPARWPDLWRQCQAFWEEHPCVGPFAPRSQRQWEEQLRTVREQGYDVADSPVTAGSRVYAAPVLGAGGTLLAVFLMSRLPRVGEEPPRDHPYIEAVAATASGIAGEFGPGETRPDYEVE